MPSMLRGGRMVDLDAINSAIRLGDCPLLPIGSMGHLLSNEKDLYGLTFTVVGYSTDRENGERYMVLSVKSLSSVVRRQHYRLSPSTDPYEVTRLSRNAPPFEEWERGL